MTYLEKLLIKGIRSYSPNDSNTIEFTSPMTLIVGANGTGKTTIIECLKYITTGNLPPNSKGGAFVYDARLAREVDIKAQVKLSFINNSGKRMVASRTIQCTQKASKIEQKTLESIVYEEGNRNEPIHLKAGENELDLFFDVPQSMLDNIIFCHQEESTWPVSEPANVKKKFDDILSSTKYSKALEALKVTKRITLTQIKLKYQELEFLYKFKEKKNEIERRLENCIKALGIKEKKEKDYAHEFKTCEELLADISKDIEKMKIINDKLKKKKEEYNNLKILKEETMTRDEAENILKSATVDCLEKEIEIIKSKAEEKESELKELEKTKIEYEKHKKEIEDRKIELKQKEITLNTFKIELEKEMKELVEIAEAFKGNKLSLCKSPTLKELEEYFYASFKVLDAQAEKKKNKLKVLRNEIEKLKDENKTLSFRKDWLDKEISETVVCEDDPSIGPEDSYTSLIEKLKNNNLKIELEKADEAYKDLQLKYQNDLKKSKEAFEVLQKKKKIDEIKKETGCNERNVKEKKEENKKQIEKNNSKIKKIKEQISEVNEKRNKMDLYKEMLRHSQANGKREIQRREEQIRLMEEESVKFRKENAIDLHKSKALEDLEKEIKKSKKKNETCAEAKIIYGNILKVGLKRGECPVCSTKLLSLEEYKNKLEKLISKVPESNAEEIKSLEEAFEKIKSYKEKEKAIENEREELERLKGCLKLEEEDLKVKIEAYNVEDVCEELELSLLDLEEDNANCERINGLLHEMEVLKEETKDCCIPINTIATENELEILKNEVINKKKLLDERETKIKNLEETQKYIEKIQANRRIIKQKQSFKEELERIKENLEKNVQELKETESQRQWEEKRLESLKENLCKNKVKIEHKLKNCINKTQTILRLEEDLRNSGEIISIDFNFKDYDNLKETIYNLRSRYNQYQQELNKSKHLHEDALKHIEHFKNKEVASRLRKEIHKIQTYFSQHRKGEQASIESHLEELLTKQTSLQERKTKIIQNKSLLQGEINQLNLNKTQITSELQKEYGRVVEDYNKAYLTHKLLELSLKDLDKLINVLDKSILDFHSLKIEEVNKILKELWSACYKGNDIDYIELKSESLSNKTYSYRISQIKNGIELEMRGRCSSGQRMLASILIRLALSQIFGSSFNVLALDEPTTNLDRENIESLALALRKIMQSSLDNKFQLIVITHDEEFVSLLTRDSAEYFYRLTRNENGNSQIYRHMIY